MNEYHSMSSSETLNRIEDVKMENRELKYDISQLQDALKEKDKDSVSTMNKIYDMRKSEERHHQSILESKFSHKKLKTLEELKQSSISEVTLLEK